MSEKKDSEERSSNSNKICDLPADTKSEEFQNMIKDPAYVCRDCGRSAGDRENLCNPQRMFSAW